MEFLAPTLSRAPILTPTGPISIYPTTQIERAPTMKLNDTLSNICEPSKYVIFKKKMLVFPLYYGIYLFIVLPSFDFKIIFQPDK